MTDVRAPVASPLTVEAMLARATEGGGGAGDRGTAARTGFHPLDRVLGGGFRSGDLAVLVGQPGVGKTIAALQWAAAMARAGRHVVYVCYEHAEDTLLGRLLAMEAGLAGADRIGEAARAAEAITTAVASGVPLPTLYASHPLVAEAVEATGRYAARLRLVRGSGARTGIDQLRCLVMEAAEPPVLFLDYLQKIAVVPEPADEAGRVRQIVESLKELALFQEIPVVAIAAAATAGLEARRMRLRHLRGSSSVAYECDIGMVMNDKYGIVAKSHRAYDPVRAATFRKRVVFSVEKNRGGPAEVDLEFEKRFDTYRFEEQGGYVAERLLDEHVVEDT